MYNKFLVTGATGFLGRAIIDALIQYDGTLRIYAFVQNNDPFVKKLPPNVSVIYGDLCNDITLNHLFSYADSHTCVIHSAGMVSVASNPGYKLYSVNVGGTAGIISHCEKAGVGKLIYVSSVHALPEKPPGDTITEDAVLSPNTVYGHYARTKAIATNLVLDASSRGLNTNVVFPSGIIGPGDYGKGNITSMLLSFLAGNLPLAIRGRYDFVDVRDVAAGIVSCAEYGAPGGKYILSGHTISIRNILDIAKSALDLNYRPVYLPIGLARLAASTYEKRSLQKGLPCFFTPYSVSVLESNCAFSHARASTDLGYTPRPAEESIRDMVCWVNAHKNQL